MADHSKSLKIPRTLAHDLIDTLAYFKLTKLTRGLLAHCDSCDSLIVIGSDLKLRLDLLALDEDLELALLNHDADEPSKHFERLLDRFDALHKNLEGADNPGVATAVQWLTVRNSIIRQAALACIRAQQQDHSSSQPFDWSTITTHGYKETIDRLMPERDLDINALDDDEQVKMMTTQKQRRDLEDIFVDKRGGVSSVKIRTLLDENNLNAFEKDMREVTSALDAALLPKPRIVQNHYAITDVDGMEEDFHDVGQEPSFQSAKPGHAVSSPHRHTGKRKADASHLARDVPRVAQELSKANDALQRDLAGRPGTVATALALDERLPGPIRIPRKRVASAGEGAGAGADAADSGLTPTPSRTSGGPITTRASPGEQVSFDDSQSVDEPDSTRFTLGDRTTPDKGPCLPLPSPSAATSAKDGRRTHRTPWTEEEVKHLHAAVAAFGKGKWAMALKHYKFKDCRTSVDLKDKWRNITKD